MKSPFLLWFSYGFPTMFPSFPHLFPYHLRFIQRHHAVLRILLRLGRHRSGAALLQVEFLRLAIDMEIADGFLVEIAMVSLG